MEERFIAERLQKHLHHFMGDLKEYLPKLEVELEEKIIEFISQVGIQSSVKTDRYSLPYTNEIVFDLGYESYINGMYELERILRPITKELLEKDVHKIRFYVFIETYDKNYRGLLGLPGCGFKYHFRYYVHR